MTEAISAKLHQQKEKTQQEVRTEHSNNPATWFDVNNAIVKQQQRYEQVQKLMDEQINLRSGGSSGFTRTETGGREHGRRDGHKVQYAQAKGSIGRGAAGMLH